MLKTAVVSTLDIPNRGERKYSYHAANNTTLRNRVTVDNRNEDNILNKTKRGTLTSRTREQLRNFALLSWMVDKYMDFTASWNFQVKTGVDYVDDQIEEKIRWWSEPGNFEVSEQHSMQRTLRILNAERIINGDVGLLLRKDGRVQVFENDMINHPEQPDGWVQGVKLDPFTRKHLSYAVCERDLRSGNVTNQYRIFSPDVFILFSFHKYHANNARGISPLSTAINSIQDIYEGYNYALAKAKAAQMIGLATFEEVPDEGIGVSNPDELDPDVDQTTPSGIKLPKDYSDGVGTYEVDPGQGVFQLQMKVGEDAKFISENTPSTQFKDFTEMLTMVVLKSLNLPMSFYDESWTNFYGSRGAVTHFVQSCKTPREDNLRLLNRLTRWIITKWIVENEIKLPKSFTAETLVWEWVPSGFPWWDTSKEVKGYRDAILAGFFNIEQVCKEIGTDFYENALANKRALDWARNIGLPPDWDPEILARKAEKSIPETEGTIDENENVESDEKETSE